jgi:hypothetical protein
VDSLAFLLSSFGDLASLFFLGDFLDNTDGNSLFHVSDGESSEGWVLVEGFNAHGFLGKHSDHSGIT